MRPVRAGAVLLLAVAAAGVIGAVSAADAAEQYHRLDLPDWAPPSWLFGPVWTVLYVTMAVAGWLLWNHEGWTSRPMALWWTQLVLNALWPPIFFTWGMRGVAFLWILALDVAVGALIWFSWRSVRTASFVLVPYMLWIVFATALAGAVWWLSG